MPVICGAPAETQAALESAEAAGVAVSFDMYPYRKSSTILAVLLLPAELQARGPERTLAALDDRAERKALLAGEKLTEEYLQHIYLGCLPEAAAEYAGLSVASAAERSSQPAGGWVLDLLVRAGLNAGAHLDRPALTGDHLAWLASDERQCAGSDGIYQGQHPHPRGYGAFARLAEHYLADRSGAGYQRLVRHLSTNAADVYGLRGRGRLAPGMAADICVIEPGAVHDRAIYGAPQVQATGVGLVIVNGVITWRDGQARASRFPGQFVS